jgi:O-antigen ligase
MITWLYRIALFVLLFGVNSLAFGGNSLHPLLDNVVNLTALAGMPALVLWYFRFPALYKLLAWPLLLGVVLLVLESLHDYGQFMYSYFVVKRFFFCALALVTYAVASQSGHLQLRHAVYLIFAFYVVNQLVLGKIFGYALTSETRTTTAYESLYLVVPFLYYLVAYLSGHRLLHLGLALFAFGLIVFLLHRSVISTAAFGAVVVLGLALRGRVTFRRLPLGQTLAVIGVLALVAGPLVGLLPEAKMDSFGESLAGILDPKEDNTGSWRVEQSEHYLRLFPERPLFGWRYVGYDRGEVMENEDFPEKGTIIHSQYVDVLYNYGLVGMALQLLLIGGTLAVLYRRNRELTNDQLVLFGFVASGLVFGISYQFPVYYWSFVGLAMYYGLKHPAFRSPVRSAPAPAASRPTSLADWPQVTALP